MSNELIDELLKARDSKNPLKQEILMAKSYVDSIYLFEGVDDFPVYDEWLKNEDHYKKSGHIVAKKGKKQIISLYEYSILINDRDVLDGCKFYVDHDYDLSSHNDQTITTLNCYSIENYIVNENSVRNYFTDEFRLDARNHLLRESLLNDFRMDYDEFNRIARDTCKPLFINYNTEEKTEFYEKISKLINIEYKNIFLKDDAPIKECVISFNSERFNELSTIFENLHEGRAIRGKYIFEFIKLWLDSLKKSLTSRGDINVSLSKKDPLMLDMRRLASSSPIPNELKASLQ